ncbi:MAG: lipopolysaccharide export system protein LptA [Alphaproteobacteria bacterium]|jgi:lipopolysaccharide export system protein LptA
MIRTQHILSLAALFWFALPATVGAQSLGFSRGGDGPIQIEADDGIEWQRANQVYVARGNARARQGGVTVEGDELIAFYRPNDAGENEIFRIDANGNVRIFSANEVARSDKAVYDIDGGVLVMTGDNIQLDTAEDTITARDSLEYYETKQLAVARGDALAIRGDRRVRADVLTAHFGEGNQQAAMERIDALGNVLVSTPTDIVRAEKGDYDPSRGIATVTGNVKITRGDTQLNGERAEVNLETGESRLLSSPSGERVRGLFLPKAKSPSPSNPGSTGNQ